VRRRRSGAPDGLPDERAKAALATGTPLIADPARCRKRSTFCFVEMTGVMRGAVLSLDTAKATPDSGGTSCLVLPTRKEMRSRWSERVSMCSARWFSNQRPASY